MHVVAICRRKHLHQQHPAAPLSASPLAAGPQNPARVSLVRDYRVAVTRRRTIWPSTASRTCSRSCSDMAAMGSFDRGALCLCWASSVESRQELSGWIRSSSSWECFAWVFGCWRMVDVACSDAAHMQLADRDAGVAAKERAAPLGKGQPQVCGASPQSHRTSNAQQVMLGRGGNKRAAQKQRHVITISLHRINREASVSCMHTFLVMHLHTVHFEEEHEAM